MMNARPIRTCLGCFEGLKDLVRLEPRLSVAVWRASYLVTVTFNIDLFGKDRLEISLDSRYFVTASDVSRTAYHLGSVV